MQNKILKPRNNWKEKITWELKSDRDTGHHDILGVKCDARMMFGDELNKRWQELVDAQLAVGVNVKF